MLVCVHTVMFKACNSGAVNNDPWSTMTSGKSPKISLLAWNVTAESNIHCMSPADQMSKGSTKNHGNSEQWKQKSEQGPKQETLHITAVPSQQKTVSLIFCK